MTLTTEVGISQWVSGKCSQVQSSGFSQSQVLLGQMQSQPSSLVIVYHRRDLGHRDWEVMNPGSRKSESGALTSECLGLAQGCYFPTCSSDRAQGLRDLRTCCLPRTTEP